MLDAGHSASFHLAVSDIHIHEMRKLKRRKYIMHSIMSVVALVIISFYSYYYSKACINSDYYWDTDEGYQDY